MDNHRYVKRLNCIHLYGVKAAVNFTFWFFFIVLLNSPAGAQTLNLDSLLTAEELNWLENNKTNIRYAPNPAWPPADYLSNGIPKGFVSDYVKLFEEMLGVNFIKMYSYNWTEVLDGLQKSKIDVVGGIHKTGEREDYLLFTQPVKTIRAGIDTKANNRHDLTNEYINSMNLACVKNFASTDFIRNEFSGAGIKIAENDLETLLLTSYDNADGAVTDLMTASYLVEKYGISNLKMGALLDFHWKIRFATSAELPELHSILCKLLQNISEEQHKAIFNKWINVDSFNKTFQFAEYKNLIIVVALLLLCLVVTVFISFFP